MAYNIEKVCESVHLGEGPFWDADTKSLYYVDIFDSYVHKYTPSTNTDTKAYVGKLKIIYCSIMLQSFFPSYPKVEKPSPS